MENSAAKYVEAERAEDIRKKPQVKMKVLWSYKTKAKARLKRAKVARKPQRVGGNFNLSKKPPNKIAAKIQEQEGVKKTPDKIAKKIQELEQVNREPDKIIEKIKEPDEVKKVPDKTENDEQAQNLWKELKH